MYDINRLLIFMIQTGSHMHKACKVFSQYTISDYKYCSSFPDVNSLIVTGSRAPLLCLLMMIRNILYLYLYE